MTAFQKPQALKAALKMALYGPAGSGKTFTALLVSEGLARHTGKRIAFCDTEYGTAFYGQEVAQRAVHPKAFDFDVLYTKSITQVLDAVRGLDPAVHGVIVIDSISHLWDACRNAFKGKLTRAGTIPLHAWGAIKKPYKELMHLLLSSPLHVLICGRQGNDFGEDDESGEMKNLGYKMRAEGETAYEPDGLNMGANLGRAAGAGLPSHVHLHVLPRWSGDTNFMTAVAGVRVLPESLGVAWEKLHRAWPGSSPQP